MTSNDWKMRKSNSNICSLEGQVKAHKEAHSSLINVVENLSEKVKELELELKTTQDKLSWKADESRRYYDKYSEGQTKIKSLEVDKKLLIDKYDTLVFVQKKRIDKFRKSIFGKLYFWRLK